NVLTLGDDEARALGVPVERTRRILVITATAITALVVSVSGIISWVGLMIPHAARMLVGPDHRYVIPLSVLLGASFVIVSDTLARTLSTGEIPIAIITSILGAPVLLHLIRTRVGHFGGSS
ncbi:MAG: iron ABC transporter permease, partial [Spirochaetaceae bacterium]